MRVLQVPAFYNAGTRYRNRVSQAITIVDDDDLLELGSDQDIGIVLRSTSLAANTVLTGVIEGTRVTQAVAANSLLIGNITDDGDIAFYVSKAGNSQMVFLADGSTGDTAILASSGQSFDVYIAGTKEIDYATAALAFQQATTISTTTGALTLSPSGNLILKDGLNFIGATSNAGMTVGITINQGANDNQILAFKSSDVAHGITDIVETDTYADMLKQAGNDGGLLIRGFTEVSTALRLATTHTTDVTTKLSTSTASVEIDARLKSGAGNAGLGADANLICFRNNATTRFILDGDGDSHQDVGTSWTNFDDEDDVALLNSLSCYVARPGNAIGEQFRDWITHNKDMLMKAEVLSGDEPGHPFINMSRLSMLLVGAVRQLGLQQKMLERKLLAIQAFNQTS